MTARTLRNLTFLFLVGGFVVAKQTALFAYPTPPYNDCPDGCTCTVDSQAWNDVTVECPDASDADICPLIYDSSWQYCEIDLPSWYQEWVPPYEPIYCEGPYSIDGCDYQSLEPPADIHFSCLCWH